MKRKGLITVILLLVAVGAVFLALISYEKIGEKLDLEAENQLTMEIDKGESSDEESEDQETEDKEKEDQESEDEESEDKNSEDKNEDDDEKPTPTPTPTLTPTPIPDPEDPILTLKHDRVEISKGGSFNLVSQVEDIVDDKDNRYALFRNIQVKGVYNRAVPGEYVLEYVVTDSDGNSCIPQKLTLVVKED